jgi:putative FmdB family regulatory protein
VPIYEYKCPNGHLFETFHGMTAPSPEACEVCGAFPLERVLFPVAVHYKGSGFYSTDYGKGSKKSGRDGKSGEGSTAGDSGSSSGSGSSSEGGGSSSGDAGGTSSSEKTTKTSDS